MLNPINQLGSAMGTSLGQSQCAQNIQQAQLASMNQQASLQNVLAQTYGDTIADLFPDSKELEKADKLLKDKILLSVIGCLCSSPQFAVADLKELRKLADGIVQKISEHFEIKELSKKLFDPDATDRMWTTSSPMVIGYAISA